MKSNHWLCYITENEFALLGLEDVAYVREIRVSDHVTFEIHTADGSAVALLENREKVLDALKEFKLESLSLH